MNSRLQKKLTAMVRADQTMRASGEWDNKIDEKNTKEMKKIVTTFGWPDKQIVGDEGAEAAWLLVQHADHDKQFQRECLGLMTQKIKSKTVSPIHVAYLSDRVNVNFGRKQWYGTQFYFDQKKQSLLPRSIRDKPHLESRRKKIGLEPFKTYAKRMKEKIQLKKT